MRQYGFFVVVSRKVALDWRESAESLSHGLCRSRLPKGFGALAEGLSSIGRIEEGLLASIGTAERVDAVVGLIVGRCLGSGGRFLYPIRLFHKDGARGRTPIITTSSLETPPIEGAFQPGMPDEDRQSDQDHSSIKSNEDSGDVALFPQLVLVAVEQLVDDAWILGPIG